MITQDHWNKLYALLHEAYQECKTNQDETYSIKVGIILDHMTENKQYLDVK